MWDEYGKAVLEERRHPPHLAELSRYLRMEYGPGTGPGYLYAAMADGARRTKRGRRTPGRVLRTLSKVVRALLPGNGRKPKTGSPAPTR